MGQPGQSRCFSAPWGPNADRGPSWEVRTAAAMGPTGVAARWVTMGSAVLAKDESNRDPGDLQGFSTTWRMGTSTRREQLDCGFLQPLQPRPDSTRNASNPHQPTPTELPFPNFKNECNLKFILCFVYIKCKNCNFSCCLVYLITE